MAEIAIVTASLLIQSMKPFLEKLNLNEDLLNQIEIIKIWLEHMKAFLQDTEGREKNKMLEVQVKQVRDIAYEIEDVLDEFVLHSPHVFHHHRITKEARKLMHNIRHAFPLRGLTNKIASINKKIEVIKMNVDLFGNSNPTPASSSTSGTGHRVSHLLCDDEMVGYENEKKVFIRHLMGGETQLVTLAMAGLGGSGKSTFVKNMCWKPEILGQFDCHAWVLVSREFDVKKFLEDLLQQFFDLKIEHCPTDYSIKEKFRNYLSGKRYIVVLDDLCNKEDWDSIKDAFPNESRGSRIVVTTRNCDLASICASTESNKYELKGLDFLDGFNLFRKKAFEDSDGVCPAELKMCSIKIVKQCQGLPFAIAAVGGALVQKPQFPNVWEKFLTNLGYEIQNDISKVLLPTYRDLSSAHKSCLLYFSLFPDNYSVKYRRLIRLWVAERFVMRQHHKTAEEVAAEYLNELIQRNLVHVSKWDFDGKPKCCRILNHVHKFIIQKCRDENFASILSKENREESQKIRRLSILGNCADLLGTSDFAAVRSLFVLRYGENSSADIWNNSWNFQVSRVIDFQGSLMQAFPRIYHLSLLRYLCFRDSNIKIIPKSIDKLPFLETLDLKRTNITVLPKNISCLCKLRHLFASNYVDFESVQGVKISGEISNLTELQNLSLVRIGKKSGIIKDLKKLGQLRKLGLIGLKREHGIDLCDSIEVMKNLTTLDLCSSTKDEYLDLKEMQNSPPLSLERLYLKGRLDRTPVWINKLTNLLRIRLKWSKVEENPLEVLQCLPNLMELEMVDSYVGNKLEFEASTFPKLKILVIKDLLEIQKIVIQKGSMPELQRMSLWRCKRLMELPSGIQMLTRVNELIFHDMGNEFTAQIRRNGENRGLVEHIPVIHSFTLNGPEWSLENLSTSIYHWTAASPDAKTCDPGHSIPKEVL